MGARKVLRGGVGGIGIGGERSGVVVVAGEGEEGEKVVVVVSSPLRPFLRSLGTISGTADIQICASTPSQPRGPRYGGPRIDTTNKRESTQLPKVFPAGEGKEEGG